MYWYMFVLYVAYYCIMFSTTVSLFIVVANKVELKYNNSDVHVFVNFIVKV